MLNLINDTFNSSNFKEGQFDAIIIGSALPNIEDDLKKLLKVGGKLFVVLDLKIKCTPLLFQEKLNLFGTLNLFLRLI